MDTLIMDQLIENIKNGFYDQNNSLPSENQLAIKYKISRHRIRMIYDRLEAMGYLKTKPGIGRFIRLQKDKIEIPLVANKSFTEKIKEMGYSLDSQLIECCEVDVKIKAFENKDLKDSVIMISRLRIINGEPSAIHTSYTLKSLFPTLLEDAAKIKSMFSYYREKGFESFFYQDSILSTTLPTSRENHLLACPSLVPVILLESMCYDKITKKLLEFTRITYRSDRFICRFNTP